VPIDSTGRPLEPVSDEWRRRPHVPPRSRREYEEQLRATAEPETPPTWTARGQRALDAEAAAARRRQADAEALAALREAERVEAARRRLHRPPMVRPRQPSNRRPSWETDESWAAWTAAQEAPGDPSTASLADTPDTEPAADPVESVAPDEMAAPDETSSPASLGEAGQGGEAPPEA